MAPKRCLFDLDLCLVKQIRPNNSVIEDIGDMNSIVAIHAAGHWPAAAIYDTGKFRILCAFDVVTKRLKPTVNRQTKQHIFCPIRTV
jgi:hypothetical protein